MLKLFSYPEKATWPEILKRPQYDSAKLESKVSAVLKDVRDNGDAALSAYTKEFDNIDLFAFEVTREEIIEAEKGLAPELKRAIAVAHTNIHSFHAAQQTPVNYIETMPGVKCWRKNVAIEKVGLYIPGGTAPLFSTVLMLAEPARIAGCKDVILCSPPGKDGKIHPAILYSAQTCGVTKIFKLGGVQAIGAMAFGTTSVPRVNKIFGPGNQFVTCAKQLVNKEGVAIDMPAGPSEVAVFADETCDPSFVAADLLSQAEHGEDSQVILVCTTEDLIKKIEKEISSQLTNLPRKEIAQKSLTHSKAILVKTVGDGIDLLNEYAPEHLILACANAEELSEKIISAGSVFIGNYSCESAGDYASGTNHTLPTNGFAKAYSGVSLDSFVKKITFQKLSEEGIRNLGPAIELMAEAEGLNAHKNAVTIRLEKLKQQKNN
jgi:histidinol dehydrogenase